MNGRLVNRLNREEMRKPIVLIDGSCHLCQGITRFLVKHDRNARFSFAALQSKAGQSLLQDGQMHTSNLDSFVLYDNGKFYIKTTAALRVAKGLGGWWRFLYLLIIIPAPLRNVVYHWVARNRYRWFGQSDACLMPTKEVMSRFVENGIGSNT